MQVSNLATLAGIDDRIRKASGAGGHTGDHTGGHRR
jgi:hypothetical protein